MQTSLDTLLPLLEAPYQKPNDKGKVNINQCIRQIYDNISGGEDCSNQIEPLLHLLKRLAVRRWLNDTQIKSYCQKIHEFVVEKVLKGQNQPSTTFGTSEKTFSVPSILLTSLTELPIHDEPQLKKRKKESDDITPVDASLVDPLKEFFITGKTTLNENIALSLLQLAEKWKFPALERVCESFLLEDLKKSKQINDSLQILKAISERIASCWIHEEYIEHLVKVLEERKDPSLRITQEKKDTDEMASKTLSSVTSQFGNQIQKLALFSIKNKLLDSIVTKTSNLKILSLINCQLFHLQSEKN